MINQLTPVEALAATSLRPAAPYAQTPAGERGAAPSANESVSLEPGKPIERELSGGQSHFYKITMISGQYLQIVFEQRGIDVAVALFAPDGKKIIEEDSKHVIEGSETVSVVAEATGAYVIEARSPEKITKTGRYGIKLEELRTASIKDKDRIAAGSIFREAKQLQNGTLESKRKGIEKYQEALNLYRRAGDLSKEAQTLKYIGEVYYLLGETQKALEKFYDALSIFKSVGSRKDEISVLNDIGAAYWAMGDTQKALEKWNARARSVDPSGSFTSSSVVDLETEAVARAILLGGLCPAG
jgi:hypothetical protein